MGGVELQLHFFVIYDPHYVVMTSEPHDQAPAMHIKAVFSFETSATNYPAMQHQIHVEGNSHPAFVLLTSCNDVMRKTVQLTRYTILFSRLEAKVPVYLHH